MMIGVNSEGRIHRELEPACMRSPMEIRHYFDWTSESYTFVKSCVVGESAATAGEVCLCH